jgi:hypothetical protein
MRKGRVGRFAGDPLEQGALARALIADDTDFHWRNIQMIVTRAISSVEEFSGKVIPQNAQGNKPQDAWNHDINSAIKARCSRRERGFTLAHFANPSAVNAVNTQTVTALVCLVAMPTS